MQSQSSPFFHNLSFAQAIGLPVFERENKLLIKRVTLIVTDGKIVKVFYPVFPPDRNANDVISWLQEYAS